MPLFKSRKVSKDESKKRVERCMVVVSKPSISVVEMFILISSETVLGCFIFVHDCQLAKERYTQRLSSLNTYSFSG